jgi:hypothetical protein
MVDGKYLQPSREGKVGLTVFITAATRKRIKGLALAKDMTTQQLLEQAIVRLVGTDDEPKEPKG